MVGAYRAPFVQSLSRARGRDMLPAPYLLKSLRCGRLLGRPARTPASLLSRPPPALSASLAYADAQRGTRRAFNPTPLCVRARAARERIRPQHSHFWGESLQTPWTLSERANSPGRFRVRRRSPGEGTHVTAERAVGPRSTHWTAALFLRPTQAQRLGAVPLTPCGARIQRTARLQQAAQQAQQLVHRCSLCEAAASQRVAKRAPVRFLPALQRLWQPQREAAARTDRAHSTRSAPRTCGIASGGCMQSFAYRVRVRRRRGTPRGARQNLGIS
jgi:hypothetical protein